ncbi:nucleoside diphosphate kinase regulator [Sphingomonas flavalba]|uniref:nucleoside diphosphate kinase regulator n=1 Tax=Sphingomonas flavalba TaxID=2559804 RepID=UPI00109DE6C1|nr:nucleoside diphosphate kinase regulator [Sphingomonas flavalba]
MKTPSRSPSKPRIVLCEEDHDRLSALADAVADNAPDLADVLTAEMQRARVVKRSALPDTVARMGSRVTFRTENGRERTVTLVFPKEADIALGRLSILTPVGVALIGLSEGQSMRWTGRDGTDHELTVLGVAQDADVA